MKFDSIEKEKLLKVKYEIEEKLEETQDKEIFIDNITNKKMDISNTIKRIDTIINDKELLKKEYIKRNENLELENKIFSIRILSQIMEKERDKYFEELEKLNKLINPQNFIKYKKEIEEKYKYLKILDTEDIEKELEKSKIQLQKIFLEFIKIDIKKAESKQEIEKTIYDFRYYLLL